MTLGIERVRLALAIPALVAALLALGNLPAEAVPIQWTGPGANNHYYEWVTGPLNWDDAQADALSRFGYLATIHSQAENDFVLGLFPNAPVNAWIGGIQNPANPAYAEPGGGWEWATTDPWAYTNWVNIQCCHEPNDTPSTHGLDLRGWEDHLAMTSSPDRPGGWFDLHRVATLPYIIEYGKTVPEPSTLVLFGTGLGLLGALGLRRRTRS